MTELSGSSSEEEVVHRFKGLMKALTGFAALTLPLTLVLSDALAYLLSWFLVFSFSLGAMYLIFLGSMGRLAKKKAKWLASVLGLVVVLAVIILQKFFTGR